MVTPASGVSLNLSSAYIPRFSKNPVAGEKIFVGFRVVDRVPGNLSEMRLISTIVV